MNNILEILPDFSYSDGKLVVDSDEPILIEKNLNILIEGQLYQ